MSRTILILGLLIVVCANGCKLSSKWANSDPDYARKYSTPYPENDWEKFGRMTKQSLDARHISGDGGSYVKGSYSTEPDAGQLELGGFRYLNSASEVHGGLSVLAGEEGLWAFPGLDFGVRLQTPSRIAPFVGAGVFGDLSEPLLYALLDDDDFDNEPRKYVHSFAAVYPEVGVHFWLDGKTRATLSAGYYFHSEGRDKDYWLIGFTLGGINDEQPEPEELIYLDDLGSSEPDNYVEIDGLVEPPPSSVGTDYPLQF